MNSGTLSTLQCVGLLAALDLLAFSNFFSVDKGGRLQVNLIIQVTLQCVRRFIQHSYHLCFLILVISQGHSDFLRQHMEGERQLIIVGIKDRARRESRCLFSWMQEVLFAHILTSHFQAVAMRFGFNMYCLEMEVKCSCSCSFHFILVSVGRDGLILYYSGQRGIETQRT